MSGISGGGSVGPTASLDYLQDFVSEVSGIIQEYSNHPVTLGSGKRDWIHYWKDNGMDFYQFRSYTQVETGPPFTPFSDLGLDKQAILGEFPTHSSGISPSRFLSAA